MVISPEGKDKEMNGEGFYIRDGDRCYSEEWCYRLGNADIAARKRIMSIRLLAWLLLAPADRVFL